MEVRLRFPAVFLLALFLCVGLANAQQSKPTLPAQLTAQELESRGDALRSQKEYIAAGAEYRRALAKAPKNAVLWNKVGMVELQVGAGSQGLERSSHFDEAKRAFERAVKFKKDYAEAINNLGVVYYQQTQYRKAIAQYKRALSIRDSASFHSNLGSVYFAQKLIPLAMQEYLAALRLDPEVFERSSASGLSGRVSRPEDRANYAILLARLYARMGDVDHAINQIKTALENGYSELEPLYQDQEFGDVRKDPRFVQLMDNKPPPIAN